VYIGLDRYYSIDKVISSYRDGCRYCFSWLVLAGDQRNMHS
jgi:hypothetical protein